MAQTTATTAATSAAGKTATTAGSAAHRAVTAATSAAGKTATTAGSAAHRAVTAAGSAAGKTATSAHTSVPASSAGHHAATSTALAPAVGVNWVHELGAMLIIVGALYLAARYMKKRAAGGMSAAAKAQPGQIVVLSRQTLSRGISIAIVHVGGKDLLVGVTPSGISLLSELDLTRGPHPEVPRAFEELGDYHDTASVERDAEDAMEQLLSSGRLGAASPLQAWMAKLDGLREMTVRKS